jgi:hypothetical protein
MSKQFATFFVSWRDAKKKPFFFDGNEAEYGRAAADALEARLNELALEGWIIDRVIGATGLTPRAAAGFTIIAFK